MIKEKNIDIRINNNMLKFYKEKTRLDIKIGDIINISPFNLSDGSHTEITAVCDVCGNEKIMWYKTYFYSTKNHTELYCCKKCSSTKIQKTLFERYGNKHALQCKEFKEKSKKTLFENYGVEIPLNSKEIRNKMNNTMMERYGVKNALENKNILDKLKNITLEKYGVETTFQREDIKEKIKKTNLERYDKECYMDTDIFRVKSKNTSMIKYGFEHHFQNKEVLEKSLISTLKMKKYEDFDLYYQGTYEKDFLDLCKKLNIINNIKRGCSVKYDMDEKHLIYFPDFYIENKNLLIEIKSLYWYNKHKNRNILKKNKCIELGFDYILIMNKNYEEFLKIVKTQ